MIRIVPISESPTIVIDRLPKVHEQSQAIEAAWRGLCAQNSRYFNGAMLAFDSYDPDTGVIHSSVEHYKNHAVRDSVDLGIKFLAVTGVLVAPNGHGELCYLLGQRSPATHRYGGLWEFGPSGGVDVPADGVDTLGLDAIVDELKREIIEEIGVDIEPDSVSPIALVHDDGVGSVDIALEIGLATIPSVEVGWEYVDYQWVTIGALRTWIEVRPTDFIPTAIALALRLGP